MSTLPEAVTELRSPATIRLRCRNILDAALRGDLQHFDVNLERLGDAAELTARVTRERYPDLQIPPHSRFNHFDAGGVGRTTALASAIADHTPLEQARTLTDVVITSVLLDAGAGDAWRYHEADSGLTLSRSEGLAVASLAWLRRGGLSSKHKPYEVDAAGLLAVDDAHLAEAFQVSDDNPLVGVAGRAELLRALGRAVAQKPAVFGSEPRPGAIVDYLSERATFEVLEAQQILLAVLEGLGDIWPGRLRLHDVSLGDVWRHPAAGGEGESAGYVPFHKLSQWLSYSLLHPLQVCGFEIRYLDNLTGLAEYRNGGLFIDSGVLRVKDPASLVRAHAVDSELIIEWRALTVALLDSLAPWVRTQLGLDSAQLPLAAMLEGGTWAAGRELARAQRPDGGPPLRVISDGTVF